MCHLFRAFFFNDTATTEIYTLSLHDALPISPPCLSAHRNLWKRCFAAARSEEHTSELQSRLHLVCRLLLEKKKKDTDEPLASYRNNKRSSKESRNHE